MTGYDLKFDIKLRKGKLLITINDINFVLKYYEIQFNDLISNVITVNPNFYEDRRSLTDLVTKDDLTKYGQGL